MTASGTFLIRNYDRHHALCDRIAIYAIAPPVEALVPTDEARAP
jgi:hypothetical protein